MPVPISLKGIDEAISNLDYRKPSTLKYRLVHLIRGFYEDEDSIHSLEKIEPEKLINALWNTGGDANVIKKRRKNLSSLKSSVNADLRRIGRAGKNPEGIIIGRNNVFVMSDEVKDNLISTFAGTFRRSLVEGDGAANLQQIAEALSLIKEILSGPDRLTEAGESDSRSKTQEIRNIIQGLGEVLGLGAEKGRLVTEAPGVVQGNVNSSGDAGIAEKVLAEKDEEYQEIDEDEEVEEDELEEVLEEVDVDMDEKLGEGEAGPTEKGEEACADELEEILQPFEEIEETVDETEAEEEIEEAVTAGDGHETELGEILEEAQPEEEIRELDADDILEEIEISDDADEVEEAKGIGMGLVEDYQEAGLLVESPGEQYADGSNENGDRIQKARFLAEAFDSYLGATEKFYNQYILIPEGKYTVGSKRPRRGERPEQRIKLAGFYIGKFPVTNALFEVFVEKTGYQTTAEEQGYGTVYYGRLKETVDERTGLVKVICNSAVHFKTVYGACWYQPFGPGSTLLNRKNHPVVQVSLRDAMAFAAWTGKRLPYENEWEAATRIPDGRTLPWGNDWKSNACNVEESCIGDTTPVDKYTGFASNLGIVDVMGNVLEWTLDRCGPPRDVKNNSKYHIVKGGSWISASDIRLFSRFKWDVESPSNIVGFRCVLTA